jgi:LysR family nod box-dependent transcriptional activator
MLRQRHAKIIEAARVPSFLLIPFMVEGTDNVALIQRRAAKPMLPFTDTVAIEPEQPFTPVQIVGLWNRARDHDPVHAWFREVLATIVPELEP